MKNVLCLLLVIAYTFTFSFSDEKHVLVVARGWGKKVSGTKLNAERNGVESLVNDMLTTEEERANFRDKKKMVLAEADKYVQNYRIKQKIKQSGKHRGKKYKLIMTLELKINKEELRKDLVTYGIILSSKALKESLDNFTIMPFVDEKKSSPEFSEKKDQVYARIGSYLQNQDISYIGEEEIRNIQANEELIALDRSSSADMGEEDLLLQLARNTKADFYIKVVGIVEESYTHGNAGYKTGIAITAYTVMTGETIASQTGHSPAYSLSSRGTSVSAGIEKAVDGAMHDIINNMRRFWKNYIKDGKPYKLIFYDFSFNELRKIRNMLKEMNPDGRLKMDKKAGNMASFTIWYKGQKDDLLFEVPGRLDELRLPLKEDPDFIGNTIRFFRGMK